MDALTIRNEHMKHRCYFISVMCSASLYNWYNYSLFDPVINSIFTAYYQNCLLMLFYLCWDTYHMTLSPNRLLLYRTDLVIHHAVTLAIYLSYINNTSLQMSNVLIMESISLMNYTWRNRPELLNIYRTACILLVRMPLSFWFWLYYNPNVIFPYLKDTRSHNYYLYLRALGNLYCFFICYDIYILWKLHKSKLSIDSSISRHKIE